MSTTEVETTVVDTASVDVADIINITVDYGKLTFVLESVLQRLAKLESQKKSADADKTKTAESDTGNSEPPTTEAGSPEIRETVPGDTRASEQTDSTAPAVDTADCQANREGTTEPAVDSNAILERISNLEKTIDGLQAARAPEVVGGVGSDLEPLVKRIEALEARPTSAVRSNAEPAQLIAPDNALESRVAALEDATQRRDVMPDASGVDAGRVTQLEGRVTELENKLAASERERHTEEPVVPESETATGVALGLDELRARLEQLENATRGQDGAAPAPPRDTSHIEQDVAQLQQANVALLSRLADLESRGDAVSVDQNPREIPSADAVRRLETQLSDLTDAVRQHDAQLQAALSGSQNGDPAAGTGITDAQFNLLRGQVEGLRAAVDASKDAIQGISDSMRAHEESIQQNRRAIDGMNSSVESVQKLCDEMRAQCTGNAAALKDLASSVDQLRDVKANRSELPRGHAGVDREVFDATIDELRRKLADHRQSAPELDPSHAAGDAIARLERKLSSLEDRVSNQQTAPEADAKEAVSEASRAAQSALAAAQQAKEQVLEIRATVDHIHHVKADAALVANKAERDYVENALEKLMREVEQVMNSTNAGLIDTLDKSLGILRDMIDGKASKSDLARVRVNASEEPGSVPEGLTGYRSYRCLGCNRTVDAMRSRPMGSNFSNFMNRLPASPRQVAPPRSAPGESRQYLTASPN